MSVNSALVFAAGFGTRMGALTKSMPKPLVPVDGKPLIDYALDLVLETKIESIVVNTHYFPDQIETHLQSKPRVVTLREAGEILETGGGLKNALSLLGADPVITLNSDAVWTGSNPIQALLNAWNPTQMDALMMLIPTNNAQEHRGQGDFCLDKQSRLSRRGSASSAPFVYSGAQIIKTERLSEIAQTSFSLNLLWDKFLASGTMYGIVHSGGWVDVGRPEGIPIAAAQLVKGQDV